MGGINFLLKGQNRSNMGINTIITSKKSLRSRWCHRWMSIRTLMIGWCINNCLDHWLFNLYHMKHEMFSLLTHSRLLPLRCWSRKHTNELIERWFFSTCFPMWSDLHTYIYAWCSLFYHLQKQKKWWTHIFLKQI